MTNQGAIGCCVSCFSSQYIAETVPELHNLSIRFIGCCYVYDSIEIGGYIINESSISMMRITRETAKMK
jgi:hypothetical protein